MHGFVLAMCSVLGSFPDHYILGDDHLALETVVWNVRLLACTTPTASQDQTKVRIRSRIQLIQVHSYRFAAYVCSWLRGRPKSPEQISAPPSPSPAAHVPHKPTEDSSW